jgi:t-SNARE complex subunit (syntaxin)
MLKQLNDSYNSINEKIEKMSSDISSYLIMTDKSNRYQFDLPIKTKFDTDIKQLSKNAKQITNDIKVLRETVQKWNDTTKKEPFEQKIKILMNKHHQNLKSLINLTEAYPDETMEIETYGTHRQMGPNGANDIVVCIDHDICSRATEVTILTSNILELREMFREMATLLEYQHEYMDLVEIEIDDAQVRTNKANKELKSAAITQKKCCCAILIVLFLFVIGAIIFGILL